MDQEKIINYITINIRVHDDNGSYVVTANSPRSRKSASCVFHMPPERWQDLEPSLRILNARSGELSQRDHVQKICEFGKALFNSLIHNEIRTLYDEKKQEAFQASKILRLNLNLVSLDLVILPWELLYDDRGSEYLCLEQRPKITIIRSTDHARKTTSSKYIQPLQILGITAEPVTLDLLDTEKEQHIIKEALKTLVEQNQINLEWKLGKYSELAEIRLSTRRYDIFHFTGHGRVDEHSQQGQLAFVGERKSPRYVSAEHLRMFLHSTTKLVVLNACETASGNRFNHLSNIAHSLTQAGFPVVIAMQFKVTNTAAITFSKTFYTLLARGITVDEAVMEARQAIFLCSEETNPLDWAAPIVSVSSLTPLAFLPVDGKEVLPPVISPPPLGDEKGKVILPPLELLKPPPKAESPLKGLSKLIKRIPSVPLWQRIVLLLLILLVGGLGGLFKILVWPSPTPGKTLCIATDFPTSGNDTQGQYPEQAVQMAIDQSHLDNGYTLTLVPYDDVDLKTRKHDPKQGITNMEKIIHNSCIVAVVGPSNSNVAEVEIPLATLVNLVLISPSTTESCLTLPANANAECGVDPSTLHPNGQNTYFRISGNDEVQGQIDANLIFDPVPVTTEQGGLGTHSVYIVDDGESFGKELASSFEGHFMDRGGSVLGYCNLKLPTCSDIAALASTIVRIHPPVVFYSGTTSTGGSTLRAALANKDFTGAFVGGDGIANDPDFVAKAGTAATGTYATLAEPDLADQKSPPLTPAQKKFVNDYAQRYHKKLGQYGANGYDAAIVVIRAIQQVIKNNESVTRETVLQATRHTSYDGVTGCISFDYNGDNAGSQFSLFEVVNGQWQFIRPISAI